MRHPCVYVIVETEKDTNCKCVYDVKTYILRCVELYVNFVKSSALNEYASSLVFFLIQEKKIGFNWWKLYAKILSKFQQNVQFCWIFAVLLNFYWIEFWKIFWAYISFDLNFKDFFNCWIAFGFSFEMTFSF